MRMKCFEKLKFIWPAVFIDSRLTSLDTMHFFFMQAKNYKKKKTEILYVRIEKNTNAEVLGPQGDKQTVTPKIDTG